MVLTVLISLLVLESVCANEGLAKFSLEQSYSSKERQNTNEDLLFSGIDGFIRYKDEKITLACYGPLPIMNALEPLKEDINIKIVSIVDCNIPTTPLVDTFKWFNINVTMVDTLQLIFSYNFPLDQGNYTTGLHIQSLFVMGVGVWYRDPFVYNEDFMESLTQLKVLMLWGTRLPKLPKKMKLEALSIRNLAKVKNWDNCEHLTTMKIEDEGTDDLPERWPSNCNSLSTLMLKDLSSDAVDYLENSGISDGVADLRNFTMEFCNKSDLPLKILRSAKNLTHLYLTHNKISDKSLKEFPMFQNLILLDLSYNQLAGWSLFDLVKQTPTLRDLKLDGNKFSNLFCNYETQLTTFTAHLLHLQRLSMDEMSTNLECLENAHFLDLQYFSFKSNETLEILYLQKLPKTKATHLEVDLRGHFVKEIAFSLEDYNLIQSNESSRFLGTADTSTENITLLIDQIDCDCNNYWFVTAIRETNFVQTPGLKCQSGSEFLQEPIETFKCQKLQRDNCMVRMTGVWGTPEKYTEESLGVIECHDTQKLRENDYYSGAYRSVGLNLSNNFVTELNRIELIWSLEWVDLRGNQLSRFDEKDIENLFAVPRVWLSRNLFICDCDNKVLLDGLHKHRHQVMDFEEIKCIDSGKPLHMVTSFEACQYGLRNAIISTSILAILVLVGLFVMWHYRQPIKIYLFSRGLCLSCLHEEDVDSDRPYDAFLSFAHGDDEFVMQELLPKLEGDPDHYRICVHYRDWVLGDWIPRQILRSVTLSKRTIIVLSRNFTKSLWGNLEFRYAMASNIKEKRSRLLVLVLDDVLLDPLEPELQGYLSLNTYLHCTDPWFDQKLKYAMPHRKKTGQTNHAPVNVLINEPPEHIILESLPNVNSISNNMIQQ